MTTDKIDLMTKIVSLAKRRGFVFQSSEIYGGLKSSYDYGPLGVELKRNIANQWWRSMVYERDNIVGLDASIIMHPKVWQTSGHLANFSDPLVDCLNCKERFRADKAPKRTPGEKIEYRKGGQKKGELIQGTVPEKGYLCPQCGSCELSTERQFRLMFQTNLGPVDPISEFLEKNYNQGLSKEDFSKKLSEAIEKSAVYLRPETAQAMFVQFQNIAQTTSMKIPFGIAQIGKSFRNEIIVEHFIFRSCEFEQMEMEFFYEPGTEDQWLDYWTNERLSWYRRFANNKDNFRLRPHDKDELAHYSSACYDIEYLYPWGFDELEGIASRTDYDLKKHSEASGVKLSYFDQQKTDPTTGKPGYRFVPYVIEPAAGLTRSLLCFLLDAYEEEKGVDAKGESKERVVLKLHPLLAPYKAAILPLVKKDGQPELGQAIAQEFRKKGMNVHFDDNQSIGKRYAKHDEIGTPYCLTIDQQSLVDQTITIRDRDTTVQERVSIDQAVEIVQRRLSL